MKLQLILPLVLSTLRSIYCQETPVQGECSDDEHGDLRLVNKQGDNYGALQVCDSEYGWRYFIWWDWTERAVTLACMGLGLPYLNTTTSTLELTEDVYVRKVASFFCIEKAQELKECINVPNWRQNVVITVNCNNNDIPTECITESDIRLVNGTSYREGRVEGCVDGRWGTVCGEGWTNEDAGHVCSKLGYSSTNANIASFGKGSRLQYNCTTDIIDCVLVRNSCQDFGVRCSLYQEVVYYNWTELVIVSNNQHTTTTGIMAGIIGILLLALIVSWVTVCVCYQQKMKIQLTQNTLSQPPTQATHPHTDVVYDYTDKIQTRPRVSCDLTSNEAYNNVVQCVTNDSYSVIPNT